jgi:hypothetical protein
MAEIRYVHSGVDGVSPDHNSCCARSDSPHAAAENTTLAARLERAMMWQLKLAERGGVASRAAPSNIPRNLSSHISSGIPRHSPTHTPTGNSTNIPSRQPSYGVLVVPDAFYNGDPAVGQGICSASSELAPNLCGRLLQFR